MSEARSKPSNGLQREIGVLAAVIGKVLYVAVAVVLLVVALGVVGSSLWQLWSAMGSGAPPVFAMLDAIGLTVLGLAVIDVSKYLIDEEVLRDRELRSPSEARRALTKFLTIITIAVSLESMVLIFDGSKADEKATLVYPALLLLVVVLIVVGLGLYQLLSARAQRLTGREDEQA